ncbi:peptidylprolyl isomerase [archaeon]|nr:MAG: peptidylprolyl isomerase [archaeon]
MADKIRCAHILVEKFTQAEEILKLLQSGADFAKTAAEKSTCPSRRRGGDLGYFGHGVMVRPFEQVAFALQKGQLSNVVKSEFGYHIIKRLD